MMPSLDAAAVAAFTDEFRLSLPAIQSAIDAAALDPLDRVQAREAHRLIHALKGAASMVGLAAFGYLLNVVEEQLEKAVVTKGPLPEDVFAIVRVQGERLDLKYLQASAEILGVSELLARVLR